MSEVHPISASTVLRARCRSMPATLSTSNGLCTTLHLPAAEKNPGRGDANLDTATTRLESQGATQRSPNEDPSLR